MIWCVRHGAILVAANVMDVSIRELLIHRVDLHEVGLVCLGGFDWCYTKSALNSCPNLFWIEEGPSADLVDRNEAFGLPVTESAKAWAG